MIYQPAAAMVATRGGGFKAVGGAGGAHDPLQGSRRLEAGLCVRVDDSAWSRPLNIAVQGAGGPFQVSTRGARCLSSWKCRFKGTSCFFHAVHLEKGTAFYTRAAARFRYLLRVPRDCFS